MNSEEENIRFAEDITRLNDENLTFLFLVAQALIAEDLPAASDSED